MSKISPLFVMIILTAMFAGVIIGLLISGFVAGNTVQLSNYDRTIQLTAETTSGKININSASAEDLAILPGIGSELAGRIIAYREAEGQFLSVDELINVEGIGKNKLEDIKQYITVGG